MSQDNIAAFFLVERVAKYLACLLGVGSQLCHIAEGLNFYLTATSSPFNQINDINVSFVQPITRVSMNLLNFAAWSPTSSHCSQVLGSGSTPIARQSVCHAVKSFSAPYHMCSSLCSASWYLFHASFDAALPRRHPSCLRKLAYEVAGGREGS